MTTLNNPPDQPDNQFPWLGKTILVGLTWLDWQNHVTEQKQLFGTITRIIPDKHLMEVDLGNDDYWGLPYYPHTIQDARRGKYQCSSNSQEVSNPEFVMSWLVHLKENGEEDSWEPNLLLYSEPVQPREWEFTPEHRDIEIVRKDAIERGPQYIGKHLLVGIYYYETGSDGAVERLLRQEQRHGEIVRANPADGIVIRQDNGEEFKMPPDLNVLERAPKMEFKLHSTGEAVVNPDYIMTWDIYRTKKDE